jgi:hypothetical protein
MRTFQITFGDLSLRRVPYSLASSCPAKLIELAKDGVSGLR